jgi:hypothetical protein
MVLAINFDGETMRGETMFLEDDDELALPTIEGLEAAQYAMVRMFTRRVKDAKALLKDVACEVGRASTHAMLTLALSEVDRALAVYEAVDKALFGKTDPASALLDLAKCLAQCAQLVMRDCDEDEYDRVHRLAILETAAPLTQMLGRVLDTVPPGRMCDQKLIDQVEVLNLTYLLFEDGALRMRRENELTEAPERMERKISALACDGAVLIYRHLAKIERELEARKLDAC